MEIVKRGASLAVGSFDQLIDWLIDLVGLYCEIVSLDPSVGWLIDWSSSLWLFMHQKPRAERPKKCR